MMAMISFTFVSCNKDDLTLDEIEALTDSSIERLQSGAVGKNYCLEFIFPVSIQFVDESIAEVGGYEDLFQTIKTWFDENDVEKTKANRPTLVFPIEVLDMDGELVDVTSQEQLKELKTECPKKGKCKGRKGKGFKCFSFVYPVTFDIGGEAVLFDDRASLKEAIKAYREEAGEDAEDPSLVFPVDIQYEDETQVTIESLEELQTAKEDCKEEGE